MNRSLLEILVDPVSAERLTLEATQFDGDEILEGILRAGGRQYPIADGIPRFVLTNDSDQQLTASSFAYKWRQRNTYESPEMGEAASRWMCKRYGFADLEEMRMYLSRSGRILDAGCGSGFSSLLCMEHCWSDRSSCEWYGVEISEAIDVARERVGVGPRRHFIQGDILQLPLTPGSFDLVFCEGVLHHTPSTEAAFRCVADMLEPGGELLCYMYRKKGPIREFADDLVREVLAPLGPEEAWNALRPLTALGRALTELDAEVEVEQDIPYLGIRAGRHDVQRLIYSHMLKLFWNPSLSFEENNHVNFDWYSPRYAHRHTEEEVRHWCEEFHLCIEYLDTSEQSGYTLRARKH